MKKKSNAVILLAMGGDDVGDCLETVPKSEDRQYKKTPQVDATPQVTASVIPNQVKLALSGQSGDTGSPNLKSIMEARVSHMKTAPRSYAGTGYAQAQGSFLRSMSSIKTDELKLTDESVPEDLRSLGLTNVGFAKWQKNEDNARQIETLRVLKEARDLHAKVQADKRFKEEKSNALKKLAGTVEAYIRAFASNERKLFSAKEVCERLKDSKNYHGVVEASAEHTVEMFTINRIDLEFNIAKLREYIGFAEQCKKIENKDDRDRLISRGIDPDHLTSGSIEAAKPEPEAVPEKQAIPDIEEIIRMINMCDPKAFELIQAHNAAYQSMEAHEKLSQEDARLRSQGDERIRFARETVSEKVCNEHANKMFPVGLVLDDSNAEAFFIDFEESLKHLFLLEKEHSDLINKRDKLIKDSAAKGFQVRNAEADKIAEAAGKQKTSMFEMIGKDRINSMQKLRGDDFSADSVPKADEGAKASKIGSAADSRKLFHQAKAEETDKYIEKLAGARRGLRLAPYRRRIEFGSNIERGGGSLSQIISDIEGRTALIGDKQLEDYKKALADGKASAEVRGELHKLIVSSMKDRNEALRETSAKPPELDTLLRHSGAFPRKDLVVILGYADLILTNEDAEILLGEAKTASADTAMKLSAELAALTASKNPQIGPKQKEKENTEQERTEFYANIGEKLGSLSMQAEKSLDKRGDGELSQFNEKLMKKMNETLPGFKKEMYKPIEKSSDEEIDDEETAQRIDRILIASKLHPGVAREIAKLPPLMRQEIAGKITGKNIKEAMEAISMLSQDSEDIDETALILRKAVIEGSLSGKDGKFGGEISEETSFKAEAEHEARKITRFIRKTMKSKAEKLSKSDARRNMFEAYLKLDDEMLVTRLLENFAGSKEEKQKEEGFLCIRAYAKFLTAKGDKSLTAEELAQESALKHYNPDYIKKAITADFESEAEYEKAADIVENQRSLLNKDSKKNRALNFIGNLIGRDISDEALFMRSLEASLEGSGRYDAELVENTLLKELVAVKTGYSIGFDQAVVNTSLRKLSEKQGWFATDWHAQLQMAGKAAYANSVKEVRSSDGKGTGAKSKADAAPQTETELKSGSELLKIERTASNAKDDPEGATLALKLLGVDYLVHQALTDDGKDRPESTDGSGRKVAGSTAEQRRANYQAIMGEIRKKIGGANLLAVTKKDHSESKTDQVKNHMLRDSFKRFCEAFRDSNSMEELKSNADKLSIWMTQYNIQGRAVAALEIKKTEMPFAEKLADAVGKEQKTEEMRAFMTKEFQAVLGNTVVDAGDVSSKLRSGMKTQLVNTAIGTALHLFRSDIKSKSFVDYCIELDKKGDEASAERNELVSSLTKGLSKLQTDTVSGRVSVLASEAHAQALASWAVDEMIMTFRKHEKGPEGWLSEKSGKKQSIINQQTKMLAKDQNAKAGEALQLTLRGLVLEDAVTDLLPGEMLQIRDYKSGGLKLKVNITPMLEAELMLEAGLSNDFTLTRDGKGELSIYLGKGLMGKIGAKGGAEILGVVAAEAGIEAGAGLEDGLKLGFGNEANCQKFLKTLFGILDAGGKEIAAAKPDATAKPGSDLATAKTGKEAAQQMLQLASSKDLISSLYGKLGASAKVENSDIVQKAADAVGGIGGTIGKKVVETAVHKISNTMDPKTLAEHKEEKAKKDDDDEDDSKKLIDAQIYAKFEAGGKIEKHKTGVDTRSVVTKAGVEAKAGIEAKIAGKKLFDKDAEAKFNASLERQFVGDKLTGALMTREYEIEGGEEGSKKMAETLANFNVKNDALIANIKDENLEGSKLSVEVEAGLTQSGLAKYRQANKLEAEMLLADRSNYEVREIRMTVKQGEFSEEIALDAGLAKVKKGTKSSFERTFVYYPMKK